MTSQKRITVRPYVSFSEQVASSITAAVTRRDWSGHRQGEIDQQRHKIKVKEAIRENLPGVISDNSIISSKGDKVIRVPIRGLEQYRFRFGNPSDGQGGGGHGPAAPGQGSQPGEIPGIDYYEADITIEELRQMMFEDLQLPNLEPKRAQVIEVEEIKFTDVRRRGQMSNLDKKRTLKNNLMRNAAKGNPRIHSINKDDIRFRTWDRTVRRESNAVVLAMMDVSGSMGEFQKYIAKAFYFWMTQFLHTKYQQVEIVFIAHHAEAKEVTEEEFFSRGESGGTIVSSAYKLALEIIDKRYPADSWNIYAFHFSDGDNMGYDNSVCLEKARELLDITNLFGYGEIRQYQTTNSLADTLNKLSDNPKFSSITIRDKSQVYPSLQKFFGPREVA